MNYVVTAIAFLYETFLLCDKNAPAEMAEPDDVILATRRELSKQTPINAPTSV